MNKAVVQICALCWLFVLHSEGIVHLSKGPVQHQKQGKTSYKICCHHQIEAENWHYKTNTLTLLGHKTNTTCCHTVQDTHIRSPV
jgi:hypothetical protein